jgi:hypothetical protein
LGESSLRDETTSAPWTNAGARDRRVVSFLKDFHLAAADAAPYACGGG